MIFLSLRVFVVIGDVALVGMQPVESVLRTESDEHSSSRLAAFAGR